MDSPLVSVIVPVYNSVKTIHSALSSVLAQSYTPIEIIVIDDGSTDELQPHLPKSNKITYFKQSNAGAGAARNKGIELANGKYVAFLDADDLWNKFKLEQQVAILESDAEVNICTTSLTYIDRKNAYERMNHKPDSESVYYFKDFREIFENPFFGTPSVLVRKDVIVREGGFETRYKTAEDVELWLRLGAKNRVCRLNSELTYIFVTPNSLSRSSNSNTHQNYLAVIDAFLLKNPEFHSNNCTLVRKVKSRVLTEWGSSILVAGGRGATAILLQAIATKSNLRAYYLLIKSLFLSARKFR